MPFTPRYDFITPFADEAMRLRRETWANPTMLSEELWAIFQQKIPQPKTPPIVIQLNTDSREGQDFIQFRDKYGGTVGAIDSLLRLTRRTTVQPRETPAIVWADPDRISSGTPLSGTQLNAVAVDPIALTELAGTYEYDPPSGTVLSDGEDQALRVVFTPSNTTSYKRARKTVHIDVGSAGPLVPIIGWSNPVASIFAGTPLSGTQLDAEALDPVTFATVPGIFTYTPPAGTVLSLGTAQALHVDFVPTDTVTYANASGDTIIDVTGPAWISESVASAGGTTVTRTVGVTAGDLIIAFIGGGTAAGLTFTASDTQANSYTQIGSDMEENDGAGTFVALSVWWAKAASTGTITVTGTASSACSKGIAVNIVQGQHPTSPIRSQSSNSAHLPGSASATTTSVAALAHDIIMAGFQGLAQPITAGAGYAGGSTGSFGFTERHVDVSAAEAATATGSAPASYTAIGFAIRPGP